jgi:polyhydroxybutyrate depolymerase
MKQLVCPSGDLSSPGCLNSLADREEFVVAYASGTRNPNITNQESRTFNAGVAGFPGYICASGYACDHTSARQELYYFNSLLDDLGERVPIDTDRIYATGISNGAAMTYRLACDLSGRIAAIAPVAGATQTILTNECNPVRTVPILDMHGDLDPSWGYYPNTGIHQVAGTVPDPIGGFSRNFPKGKFVAVPANLEFWRRHNGCSAPLVLDSVRVAGPDDGTSVERYHFQDCQSGAEVIHDFIRNGGHTWPGGFQIFPQSRIGLTTHAMNANEEMWQFFKLHSLRDGT